MKQWNDKPYHSLDYELKTLFGEKVYRILLNGGCSCPNRDGTLGYGGCIFCSEGGSGDFAGDASLSITRQIEAGKALLSRKRPVKKYIAYFQAFTGTYAPVEHLRATFTEAIRHPEVAALSIATRPDCLPPEVLALLDELQRIKPVWIELGLQTIHSETARLIRRGSELPVFQKALDDLSRLGIPVIVHVILGLPGETQQQMLETIRYLNQCPIQGIKLQLLHILKGTDLALYYREHPFYVFTMEEYVRMVVACVERLRPEVVIHRLTGDGPKELLVAPKWSAAKRTVLGAIHREFRLQDTWQGKYWQDTAL